MKPEISKSARELLARQLAAEPHPSPDLLNAYVEQSLSSAENTHLMTHLSACAECREVVFLASGAAEEEVLLPLVAAAKPVEVRLPAAAMPVPDELRGCAVLEPRPKSSRNWWKWAAPLAALVIVGSTALIERDRIAELLNPPSSETAYVRGRTEAAPAISPETPAMKSGTPPQPSPTADSTEQHANALSLNLPEKQMMKGGPASARASNKKNGAAEQTFADTREDALRRRMLESQLASNLENPHADLRTGTAQAKAAPSVASVLQSDEAASNAPNGGNDLTYIAPDAVQPQSLAKSSLVANDQAAGGSVAAMSMARQKAAGNSHWRIGKDGQLERSTGTGTWTQKLTSEEVTFRAVASVGNDVWAGGNGGALFHSSDSGEHFNKVMLSANGQTERGAIVSIHFDTVQQGRVTSDAGATWTTADGGQSWSKQ
jgi:hypothetical protein